MREHLEDLDDDLTEHTGPDTDPEDTGLRLTPLDPKRPAPDLLEDLLTGIHACQLLHEEYDDPDDEDADADEAEDRDDEHAEQHQDRSRERFAHLVRETATRHRDRLT
ncbi:Voldacs domain-containing protein [Kitasatospora sp. NPDC092286]|uniref:Voldacs domain-containing protein n=1 Tax=Kitasatospora sp. NPDC092286 TaxID=3364087 RepID=UPI0038048445